MATRFPLKSLLAAYTEAANTTQSAWMYNIEVFSWSSNTHGQKSIPYPSRVNALKIYPDYNSVTNTFLLTQSEHVFKTLEI